MKRIVLLFLVTLVLIAVFAGCQQEPPAETANDSEEAIIQEATTTEPTMQPYEGELTTILLMGSMDGDFSNPNNQDYVLTHILITLDPKTRSLRFTTIPYNLKIKPAIEEIDEYVQMQSIYSQYGPDVVVSTLEERFDINIEGWVVMNMGGVMDIVDSLGGLQINITSLTINEAGHALVSYFGFVFDEVEKTGLQILKGNQVAAYFIDTYFEELDPENPFVDEEERFRQRHSSIITALVSLVRDSEISNDALIEIARSISENYITNIDEAAWEELSKMAVACAQNEPDFLHLPSDSITVEKYGYMSSLVYDENSEPAVVSSFVNGE